jgi:hypothetical protein
VIKKMLLSDQSLTVDQLHERVTTRGIKISIITVASIRSHFLDDLKFLKAMGVIKFQVKHHRIVQQPRREQAHRDQWPNKKRPFRKWDFSG